MPTYIYETIPSSGDRPPRTFGIRQGMTEPPLTRDPETGDPVRRVVTGGIGVITSSKGSSPQPSSAHCCGSACGCG
jgi:predicted nucleic acid-binding Zn ribbon protein